METKIIKSNLTPAKDYLWLDLNDGVLKVYTQNNGWNPISISGLNTKLNTNLDNLTEDGVERIKSIGKPSYYYEDVKGATITAPLIESGNAEMHLGLLGFEVDIKNGEFNVASIVLQKSGRLSLLSNDGIKLQAAKNIQNFAKTINLIAYEQINLTANEDINIEANSIAFNGENILYTTYLNYLHSLEATSLALSYNFKNPDKYIHLDTQTVKFIQYGENVDINYAINNVTNKGVAICGSIQTYTWKSENVLAITPLAPTIVYVYDKDDPIVKSEIVVLIQRSPIRPTIQHIKTIKDTEVKILYIAEKYLTQNPGVVYRLIINGDIEDTWFESYNNIRLQKGIPLFTAFKEIFISKNEYDNASTIEIECVIDGSTYTETIKHSE